MLKYQIVFIFILSLIACNNQEPKRQQNQPKALSIQMNSSYNFSDLFDDVEILNLEGPIVGQIEKLVSLDSSIFFITRSGEYRLHHYNQSNGMLKGLVKKGIAPNEMESIDILKTDGKRIFVSDIIRSELRTFDSNGNLLSQEKLPDSFDDFAFIQDDILVGFKKVKYEQFNNESKINVYQNQNNDFVKLYQNQEVSMLEFERAFNQLQNLFFDDEAKRVLFTHAFTDTIYSITEKETQPLYLLKFGDYTIDYESYYNEKISSREFFQTMRESNYIWSINTICISDKYLFFTFRLGDKIHSTFINLNDLIGFAGQYFIDDVFADTLQNQFNPDFLPVHMDSKFLYVVAEPQYLINDIGLNRLKNFKELEKLAFDDNQVILKFKFK